MSSIRTRIITAFLGLLIPIVIIFGLFLRSHVQENLVPEIYEMHRAILKARGESVDAWIHERIAELEVVGMNEVFLGNDQAAKFDEIKRYADALSDRYESLGFVSMEGVNQISNGMVIDISSRPYFQMLQDHPDQSVVISDPIWSLDRQKPIVVILSRVKSSGKTKGYLSAAVDISALTTLVSKTQTPGGRWALVNGEGIVFAHNMENKPAFFSLGKVDQAPPFEAGIYGWVQSDKKVKTMSFDDSVMDFLPIGHVSGWTIVSSYDKRGVLAGIMAFQSELAMISLIVLVLALLMIMPLSSSLSQPIVAFESLTRQVQTGNFQGNYPPTRIREISNLSLSFQHMVDRIQSLIGEVEEKEKRKREAELQALQMQIAPHFLYNTLDTLYYMGIEAEAMELSQGIRDLTTLLRNGLNRGREWTSVKREIEHVKSYLSIQKLRYEDKIQYAIDVDPRIESCSVPKLILQPLVENAIYHGIKEKDGSGKIWISVQPDGDRIRFVVRDSGVGMTEQKAALLQDMIESGRTFNEGVGFQNVMERLRLIYGRHFDAKVESEIGTGTKVFLWVRKECEGHAANFSG